MNNFKCIFIVIGLIMSYCFQGQDISEETAQMVAQNFISLKSEKNRSQKVQLINITNRIDKKYDGFYIFKNENGNGFYIISSESGNHPVLAYSLDSPLSTDGVLSPEFLYILNNYQAANEYLRKNKTQKVINEENLLIKGEWKALLTGKALPSTKSAKASLATNVAPLLKTNWSQSPYYNKFSPTTYEGKPTLTGCAATAIAQIMKFWNYPAKGNGTHTYTISNDYYNWKGKTLTANFGNTTYLWNNMPNSLSGSSSTQQVDAVATLMLHAGISIDMMYGPYDSGARSSSLATALKNYFKYSPDIMLKYKSDYSNDSEWLNLIKGQVAKGYPVCFTGTHYSNREAHAFIADGYDANNLIHFNFGWGGSANGYYQITDPQGYSKAQKVIINIYPFALSCSIPEGLTTSNLSENGVTLKWNAAIGAQNYRVEYKLTSATNWTVANASTTTTSFTLSGLNPNSSYVWRVKTNCSSSKSSEYAQGSFKTFNVCPVPTGLTTSNLSKNSVTLKWNTVKEALYYIVEYKLASATNWTIATPATKATSFPLSHLNPNSSYLWRVKIYCPADRSSGYAQGSFKTLGVCSVPVGLSSSNLSTNGATLKWKAVAEAQNYTVEYKIVSATNWTIATTTAATSFTLSGLKPKTTYHWRLKANCSEYIQNSFTTLEACSAPTGLTVSYTSTDRAILEWNESDFMSYTLEYRASSDPSWTVAAAYTNRNYFMLSGLKRNTTYYWRVKIHCSTSSSSVYSQSSFKTISPYMKDIPNEEQSSSIFVYPNPVEDIIYIKGIKVEGDENLLATIIDRNGKIVKNVTIQPNKEIYMDVSELPSNVYFLRIKDQTLKFIKK